MAADVGKEEYEMLVNKRELKLSETKTREKYWQGKEKPR